MTRAWIAQTRWSVLAVAGLVLCALPAQAQRVSLTDLQNQIAASVTCPAALPGQPRYTDKGDGTICDAATGLMWEKKLDCGGVILNNPRCVLNVYTWTDPIAPRTEPTGTLFEDFLEQLNDLKLANDGAATPCFAGHCDWRIPTVAELRSILIAPYPICPADPCIDPIFGPTSRARYWSSTSFVRIPTAAWTVYFPIGSLDLTFKEASLAARAVRGGR